MKVDRAVVLLQSSLRPFLMLDEGDDVGADVYPWPGEPMTQLDVQSRDDVGADVYPWPGEPMTQFDVKEMP
jgi:hypothetical protein